MDENKEWIAGGVMIAVGIAIMATGFGGPIGVAILAGAAFSAGSSVLSQKATTGQVDWTKVGTDAIVGGIAGATGIGVAAGLGRAAQLARAAALADDASRVAQVANKFGSTAVRVSVSGGASGAAGNVAEYQFTASEHTASGYLQAGGTGMLFGAAGSAITSRAGGVISAYVGQKLTPNWLAPVSGRPHAGPPANYGQELSEIATNHIVGGIAGLGNAYAKPGSADGSDIMSGLVQGTLNGAEGPTMGRW